MNIQDRSVRLTAPLRDACRAAPQELAREWADYHRRLYQTEDGQARLLDVGRAAYWQSIADRATT